MAKIKIVNLCPTKCGMGVRKRAPSSTAGEMLKGNSLSGRAIGKGLPHGRHAPELAITKGTGRKMWWVPGTDLTWQSGSTT